MISDLVRQNTILPEEATKTVNQRRKLHFQKRINVQVLPFKTFYCVLDVKIT